VLRGFGSRATSFQKDIESTVQKAIRRDEKGNMNVGNRTNGKRTIRQGKRCDIKRVAKRERNPSYLRKMPENRWGQGKFWMSKWGQGEFQLGEGRSLKKGTVRTTKETESAGGEGKKAGLEKTLAVKTRGGSTAKRRRGGGKKWEVIDSIYWSGEKGKTGR